MKESKKRKKTLGVKFRTFIHRIWLWHLLDYLLTLSCYGTYTCLWQECLSRLVLFCQTGGTWPTLVNQLSSAQFIRSVMSDSLQPRELQHTRPPCPSPTPGVHSDSRPSSQWCHPAISSSVLLPPIPLSIRVFSNESTHCMRWPKYWSFSFSIIPSIEQPGLISFRMDWLDLLAVQGTCKSLLQRHSSKVSMLRHSAFFTVQLSHPYITTGKIIALTKWTFLGKVMSLLFNVLSRLVITLLPRSKRLLIS